MARLFSFCLILFLTINASAQNDRGGLVQSAAPVNKTKDRLAMVIGNANYSGDLAKLANPLNDADSMAQALQKLQFDVILVKDADLKTMKTKITEFGEKLKEYNTGLFFYAGHGAESKGVNYLFPVGASPASENEMEFECYNVSMVLAKMESAATLTNMIILDACRNNPFAGGWSRSSGGGGLSKMEAPKGTFIGFAASPGALAADGKGSNGVYTDAILKNLRRQNLSLLDMFTVINKEVRKATNDKQVPFLASSLNEIFYFRENNAATPAEVKVQETDKKELIAQRIYNMFPAGQLSRPDVQVAAYLDGPGNYSGLELPLADECGAAANITYNFQHFYEAADKKIEQKFNDDLISPYFSDSLVSRSESYYIFFFKDKKSYKIEYRLAVNDENSYDAALGRLLDFMNLKDKFYYESGPYYYSVWKDEKMGFIKIAIGLKEMKKVCVYDWWFNM
jgi:hypothetical protein